MKLTFWNQFLVIFFLPSFVKCVERIGPVPCPLKWISINSNDPVPSNAVVVQSGRWYIARNVPSSPTAFGRVEVDNGTLLAAKLLPTGSSSVFETQYFQLLVNPHSCFIQWTMKNEVEIDLAFREESLYFGRSFFSSQFVSGTTSNYYSGVMTYIPDSGGSPVTTSDFSVLCASSKGLSYRLHSFTFLDSMSLSADLMGVDEIHNKADVEVTQTVTHTKSVTESFSLTNSKEETISFDISVDVSVEIGVKGVGLGVGVGASFGMSFTDGQSSEVSTSKTKELSVSRSVTVPPRTVVRICSAIKSAENFTISYTAVGEYSAPGLSGSQVLNYVKDHFPQATVGESSAVIEASGSLVGSLFLNTLFTVQPIDAVVPCDTGAV